MSKTRSSYSGDLIPDVTTLDIKPFSDPGVFVVSVIFDPAGEAWVQLNFQAGHGLKATSSDALKRNETIHQGAIRVLQQQSPAFETKEKMLTQFAWRYSCIDATYNTFSLAAFNTDRTFTQADRDAIIAQHIARDCAPSKYSGRTFIKLSTLQNELKKPWTQHRSIEFTPSSIYGPVVNGNFSEPCSKAALSLRNACSIGGLLFSEEFNRALKAAEKSLFKNYTRLHFFAGYVYDTVRSNCCGPRPARTNGNR